MSESIYTRITSLYVPLYINNHGRDKHSSKMSKIDVCTSTAYDKTPQVKSHSQTAITVDTNPPSKGNGGYETGKQHDEVVTWDIFTKNTTFHGVKYVFDKSTYRFRR